MSRLFIVVLAVASVALIGCKKEKSAKKLPPADDWQASPMSGQSATGQAGAARAPHAGMGGGADPHAGMGGGADPHAGMGMGGADPHAGMDMGGTDPHAGMDMGGTDPHAGMNMGGADPHAGMGGGDPHAGDPMATMQAPDPNRAIDESRFLKGTITTTDKTRDLIKAGAMMFVSVKPIEPVTGEPVGGIVAVDRIDVTSMPVTFHLSERNAMSAGTKFEGDVVIYARIDGDGEARTRSPGDVEGSIRAKIPADKLELKLDTVLR